MKKILLVTICGILFASNSYADSKYECWAYKNGKPNKMVHAVASNKSKALSLAAQKFKKLGINASDIRCK